MWDTKTLALIKTIPVDGGPDGILGDAFNHRVYIFSHSAPNVTVLDATDGSVLGTIDLGGAPEQAATDGKGHIYVDIEDKDSVAVVDAKTMKVTATVQPERQGRRQRGPGAGCEEPRPVRGLPEPAGDGDARRQRRQVSRRPADRPGL